MIHDLGIEGGTVVTSATAERRNVYVSGARITAVTDALLPARRRVAADGLLVMPGMVDTHVHLMDPGDTEREDFPTGTRAAAIAGVTTIVEHTHVAPVRTAADLAAKRSHLASRSVIDYGLAAHAWVGMLDQIPDAWRSGVTFFKLFTCTTHGVPGFDAAQLLRAFRLIAEYDAVALVHAEEESIVAASEGELRAAGRIDPGLLPVWRSREAELTALAVTSLLALRTGARVTTAHASHVDAIATVAREQANGAQLAIETCPQYLTLLAGEVELEAGLRKFTPPARASGEADLGAMWAALADGRVTLVSTDHAPATQEQKTSGTIWDVHFGLPGLDTTLPVLLDGAARGLISYQRVSALYAEQPARWYRLPAKGRIEPGMDADLVLVDPNRKWTVDSGSIHSKAGWSPFEGRTLTGGAVATYLRGRLVARDGLAVASPGYGHFLPGPGARS